MPLILEVIVSGIIASLVMIPFFRISRVMGSNVPSLIEVVGTLFTPNEPRAKPLAVVLHVTFGIAWAFLYYAFVRLFGNPHPVVIFTLCTGASAFQGLIVSFNLANMVAEHPHHREFQVQSPAVAATYLITHVIYGGTLGFLFAMFEVVPG